LPDIAARLGALEKPISAAIEEIYGVRIAEIEQSIEAIALDAAAARKLGADPGSPALKAMRRYYDESGRLLELAIGLHPGERFTYVTRLKRA
jgi:DNA-binding GntR family transcriptional regulator